MAHDVAQLMFASEPDAREADRRNERSGEQDGKNTSRAIESTTVAEISSRPSSIKRLVQPTVSRTLSSVVDARRTKTATVSDRARGRA
jgi:hypothetical protein